MKIDDKTGLVLEGGGMRGVFTCGVLDCFLDNNISFKYGVGVSAGACNGLSYLSRQRGRSKFSNIDMLEKYGYIGLKYLFTQRSIFDMRLLYEEFPSRILPYDYDTCFANPMEYEMVTTDCTTGRPLYMNEKSDAARLLQICKASSSLPYVSPMVEVDGIPMLDGGIGDSIPLKRAIEKGYERNVVVLTRNRGYRKSTRDFRIPRFIYKKYPRLRVALSHRNKVYNEQLAMVERMEDEGRIIVIRPQKPIVVGRIERDTRKLTDLYEEGYKVAQATLNL